MLSFCLDEAMRYLTSFMLQCPKCDKIGQPMFVLNPCRHVMCAWCTRLGYNRYAKATRIVNMQYGNCFTCDVPIRAADIIKTEL